MGLKNTLLVAFEEKTGGVLPPRVSVWQSSDRARPLPPLVPPPVPHGPHRACAEERPRLAGISEDIRLPPPAPTSNPRVRRPGRVPVALARKEGAYDGESSRHCSLCFHSPECRGQGPGRPEPAAGTATHPPVWVRATDLLPSVPMQGGRLCQALPQDPLALRSPQSPRQSAASKMPVCGREDKQ